jgi:hypothetical protein
MVMVVGGVTSVVVGAGSSGVGGSVMTAGTVVGSATGSSGAAGSVAGGAAVMSGGNSPIVVAGFD